MRGFFITYRKGTSVVAKVV